MISHSLLASKKCTAGLRSALDLRWARPRLKMVELANVVAGRWVLPEVEKGTSTARSWGRRMALSLGVS